MTKRLLSRIQTNTMRAQQSNGRKLYRRACDRKANGLLQHFSDLLANEEFFTRLLLVAQFVNSAPHPARLAQESAPPK
jgi:hypothetical protein